MRLLLEKLQWKGRVLRNEEGSCHESSKIQHRRNYIVHQGLYIFITEGLANYLEIEQLVNSVGMMLRVSKTLMNVVMKSGILLVLEKRLCPCEICLNQTTPFFGKASPQSPLALCRRAFYLRRLRLSNVKLFVAKCSRKVLDDQSVPPWNFSAVLQLVKTTCASAIRMQRMGPESMSRFDISWDSRHVHLPDEGPIDHTDDPIFELSKSWILWTNLCPQSVRRSVQNWNPMWISLLRHVSESVCYQSSHFLRRDDSYIKSATNSTDSLMEHENMDDNRVIGEHSLPGFSMNENTKLYLLIGSDNTNGLNACISAEFYKYLAAVHITRNNGKETALLCIAEGGHISTAISKSSLFPQKNSALRRRIARARRAIARARCVVQ